MEATENFPGELKGTYYSLLSMSDEEKAQLVKDHFLFKDNDRFLEAAGLQKDWPEGRGVFHNREKTFWLWINEEDQLRVISLEFFDNPIGVYARVDKALRSLENSGIKFAKDENLGYLTSCPTNIGTGLRASVHVKLPLLGKDMNKLKELAASKKLQIRGVDGEHSESRDSVFDISNTQRLGRTEN